MLAFFPADLQLWHPAKGLVTAISSGPWIHVVSKAMSNVTNALTPRMLTQIMKEQENPRGHADSGNSCTFSDFSYTFQIQ